MSPRHSACEDVVAEGRTNATNLVRRNLLTLARTAKDDPTINITADDVAPDGGAEFRIVISRPVGSLVIDSSWVPLGRYQCEDQRAVTDGGICRPRHVAVDQTGSADRYSDYLSVRTEPHQVAGEAQDRLVTPCTRDVGDARAALWLRTEPQPLRLEADGRHPEKGLLRHDRRASH